MAAVVFGVMKARLARVSVGTAWVTLIERSSKGLLILKLMNEEAASYRMFEMP